MIGRQRERSELHRAFVLAQEGKGGIVLLAGEAGVGKTLLAEESLARSELKVFTARATEEVTPPYGPIVSVLRDYLRGTPEGPIDCGPLTQYLALLLPELGPPPEQADPSTLTEAMSNALTAMARRSPSIIFLDDLQWADNATLELLPSLSDRLHNERLLILGTYRSDEIPRGHRIRWLRHELRRRGRLQEIHLEPLDRDESAALMKRVLGASPGPALVQTLYEQTQGVPLFVEELSSTLVARGCVRLGSSGVELIPGKDIPIPESIRDIVLLRLDGLSEQARRQLEVAAVVGMEFDLELVARLAGEEAGLDELFDGNLIVETDSGRGAFRHALTREAVRSEITWSRRRSLNRHIATYLESAGTPPEVIAEHWLAAHELVKARKALLASAERSCHLHAYRDAARAAYRALEIWPEGEEEERRLEALERLAHCAQVSGQLSDAARVLRELVASPKVVEDHRRHGEAQRSLAIVYSLQGAWEQALTARKTSAESFEKAGLPGEAAAEWLAAAERYDFLLQLTTALEMAQRADRLAREAERWDVLARALGLEGDLLSMQGKPQEGREIAQAGLSLAPKYHLREVAFEVYWRLARILDYASDFSSARDAYSTAYDYCRNQGADVLARFCLGCMSYLLFRIGDWKKSAKICREVIRDQEAPAMVKSACLGTMGLIRAHRGEIRQARNSLQESLNLSRREAFVIVELFVLWGLALVDEQEGADAAAEARYRQLLERWKKTEDRLSIIPALCSAGTFFAIHHFEKETVMCAEALATAASATNNPEALGGLAYTLGEMALLSHNADEAARQFVRALSQFEELGIPMECVKAELRAGLAFVRAGSRETGIGHLMNAYRLARKLGARPLALRIADELEALGEPAEERRSPKSAERASRRGLTWRQVEIARLIASGLTNKEIAHKLFLSPRTVEMHVAHLLNRLDCRSRSEAVRKAGELGLLD